MPTYIPLSLLFNQTRAGPTLAPIVALHQSTRKGFV